MTDTQELTKAVYAAFDPAPLGPGQSDLYVDLDVIRGDEDGVGPVDRIAERIRLSTKPLCRILAGHRGSGKTTELHRLQNILEDCSPRYFVVFCEADKDIERNDVDFPDVLTAMIRQLAGQLRARAHIDLKPSYFTKIFEQTKELLGSDIDFESLDLDTGLLKLSGSIKSGPDTRKKIRALLEPRTKDLLTAANDVIGLAEKELKKLGYERLIIIVDDLDKMILRKQHGMDCSTGEYLFIHRESQLRAFACHVLYTMPLALAYSNVEQNIADLYGGPTPVIPMIKISEKPPSTAPHEPGYQQLREMIQKRLDHAQARHEDVFESNAVETELIRLCGGQPRELMILIRDAIVGAGFPITPASVERAARDSRRAFARELHKKHWPIIHTVMQTGMIERTDDNEPIVRDLLDSRAILQYSNENEWYNVNPLIPDPPDEPTE